MITVVDLGCETWDNEESIGIFYADVKDASILRFEKESHVRP